MFVVFALCCGMDTADKADGTGGLTDRTDWLSDRRCFVLLPLDPHDIDALPPGIAYCLLGTNAPEGRREARDEGLAGSASSRASDLHGILPRTWAAEPHRLPVPLPQTSRRPPALGELPPTVTLYHGVLEALRLSRYIGVQGGL